MDVCSVRGGSFVSQYVFDGIPSLFSWKTAFALLSDPWPVVPGHMYIVLQLTDDLMSVWLVCDQFMLSHKSLL